MTSPVNAGMLATFWILLGCIQMALGGYERNCDFYRPPSPMGKCGKQLADLVDNVCKFYYGGKKRSTEDQQVLPADTKAVRPWLGQDHEPLDGGVFLAKDKALSVLGKRGAYQGRITCECCQYQCTFHELSQYCSVIAIKRSSRMGIGGLLLQSPASDKESEDIKDKQMIGRMLRKYGPQWLENYMQYLDV